MTAGNTGVRAVVAQLGARMRYAVPRMMEERGWLDHLYTDWLRFDPGIPPQRVTRYGSLALEYWLRQRIGKAAGRRQSHVWAGMEFNRRVLGGAPWEKNANVFYGFKTASLELLRSARDHGIHGMVEQTSAPWPVEHRILEDAVRRWPGWSAVPVDFPEYRLRERDEWEAAGMIVCGSEFVRQGLEAEGVPAAKISVVPYGIDLPAPAGSAARPHGRQCVVIFVGTVCLQKGIPVLLEAAKTMRRPGLRFCVVGSVSCNRRALREAVGDNVDVLGHVPYGRLEDLYAQADIFCLPSFCEGSARVVYEALAMGLPVVTTPAAGSIVRDGIEGRIVPAGDVVALRDALDELVRDDDRRHGMYSAALQRAAFGSIAAYRQRLCGVVEKCVSRRGE